MDKGKTDALEYCVQSTGRNDSERARHLALSGPLCGILSGARSFYPTVEGISNKLDKVDCPQC